MKPLSAIFKRETFLYISSLSFFSPFFISFFLKKRRKKSKKEANLLIYKEKSWIKSGQGYIHTAETLAISVATLWAVAKQTVYWL